MTKEPRRPIPREVELSVLDRSRRRCALCFHLKGDLGERHGQIAHLDDNPGNGAEDNLAFLCIEHHSLYDSTTRQHKNYTIGEAKSARLQLYATIADGRHISGARRPMGQETDRKALSDLIQLMTDTGTMRFLRDASFAGWSWSLREIEGIDLFLDQSKGAEHEFIDDELEALRQNLIKACHAFRAPHFQVAFPTRHVPSQLAIPREWEREQPDRFEKAVTDLHAAAHNLCVAYDDLVRAARKKLSI